MYKTIAFKIPIKMHAEFKARLVYDHVSMTKFIRSCIKYYLQKDPIMLDFISKLQESESIHNKTKRNYSKKLLKNGKRTETLFNLSDEEIENIYDVIGEI
jgi:hypothetical protein